MHDTKFEDRLRQVLHEEAGALPFTITADELRIRLDERRRNGLNRMGFLSAAAAIVVVVGVGAVLMMDRGAAPPVGSSQSPTPTETASPQPSPDLDSFEEIEAAIGQAGVIIHTDESIADPAAIDEVVVSDIGPISTPGGYLDVASDCFGPGPFKLTWRDPQTREPLSAIEYETCDGPTEAWTAPDLPEVLSLEVQAGSRTSWRLAVYAPQVPAGSDPPVSRPQIDDTTVLDERAVEGNNTTDSYVVPLGGLGDDIIIQGVCLGDGTLQVFDGTSTHVADCSATDQISVIWSAVAPASLELPIEVRNIGDNSSVVAILRRDPEADPPFVVPTATVSGDGEGEAAIAGCALTFQLAGGENASHTCPEITPVIPADRALRVSAGSELTLEIPGWRMTGLTGTYASSADVIAADGFGVRFGPLVDMDGGSDTVTFAAPGVGDWTLNLLISATRDGDTYSVPYVVRVIVEP